MLTWVLPSALVAFLWAAADIFSKMILNMGLDFKVFFVLGSFAYFLVGLTYFIIDKKTRDKFIKLKDLKWENKKKLLLLTAGFALMWGIGEILYDYALTQTKNIGYIRSIVVCSALILYTYSVLFMGAEYNRMTLAGVISILIGVFLIVNYSGNDKK
jgi:drug/metabolite transporter (DMT)-like permease